MTPTVVAASLLLQIVAAVLAFRLVRVTGKRTAWLVIAAAIALMAVRRAVSLQAMLSAEGVTGNLAGELVALLISVLMVVGIGAVAPLIHSIRRAEREVRQVVEAAPDAMIIADAADRVVLVNARAVRMFGYTRSELIGKDVELLVPERFRTRHRAKRAQYHEAPRHRVMGGGEALFALRRDGTEVPVEISISPLETAHGPLVVSAIRDLTDAQRADEKLRESESRNRILLDDVLDSSAVGVCILDQHFDVIWVNRAFESYFGLQRREVVGMNARRLVAERLRYLFEDHKDFSEKVLATYANNTYVEHFECHVVAGEGRSEHWLEHWSQPIESGIYQGGRIEHYTNVTERKEAEDRIRLFARIARNMQIGLLVYRLDDLEDDRSLRLVSLNPEAERLLGVNSSVVMGKRIDEAFPGLRERGTPALFANVLRSGEAQEVEDFDYGDSRVIENAWSFKAFPLPDQCVGVVFERITERKRSEELLQNLAAGVAGDSGETFFRSLVRYLAKSIGLEYAMVGELVEPDHDSVQTLAYYVKGRVVDNIRYSLDGAPCANVVGKHMCCYPRRVAELFPRDAALREMNAESYVGSPLFDSTGQPIGLISVLGESPLQEPETAKRILQIFAARAAAEIERMRIAAR